MSSAFSDILLEEAEIEVAHEFRGIAAEMMMHGFAVKHRNNFPLSSEINMKDEICSLQDDNDFYGQRDTVEVIVIGLNSFSGHIIISNYFFK